MHILQPLDMALFRTFKMAWQKSFQAFCQKCGTACGLSPLDVNAVDFRKVFNRLKTSSSETISNLETTEENIKNIEGLTFLESLIDKTKLESFKNHGSSNWTGPEEDKSLFDVWYSATNNKKNDQIVDFPEDVSKDDETMENDNVDLLLGLTFDIHENLIQDLNAAEQLTASFLTPELPVVIVTNGVCDGA
ncbi:hypothetical protein KQX54_014715 [Cotesia glomerata]|uniref:Uncharacterized protein n=1 Tax=Cotesia glomerata TaxID=32391 RepID=A0AAV7I1E8_COTGL|nr:hypothetical protein KQX54_014715 [Cotesia glomerata]